MSSLTLRFVYGQNLSTLFNAVKRDMSPWDLSGESYLNIAVFERYPSGLVQVSSQNILENMGGNWSNGIIEINLPFTELKLNKIYSIRITTTAGVLVADGTIQGVGDPWLLGEPAAYRSIGYNPDNPPTFPNTECGSITSNINSVNFDKECNTGICGFKFVNSIGNVQTGVGDLLIGSCEKDNVIRFKGYGVTEFQEYKATTQLDNPIVLPGPGVIKWFEFDVVELLAYINGANFAYTSIGMGFVDIRQDIEVIVDVEQNTLGTSKIEVKRNGVLTYEREFEDNITRLSVGIDNNKNIYLVVDNLTINTFTQIDAASEDIFLLASLTTTDTVKYAGEAVTEYFLNKSIFTNLYSPLLNIGVFEDLCGNVVDQHFITYSCGINFYGSIAADIFGEAFPSISNNILTYEYSSPESDASIPTPFVASTGLTLASLGVMLPSEGIKKVFRVRISVDALNSSDAALTITQALEAGVAKVFDSLVKLSTTSGPTKEISVTDNVITASGTVGTVTTLPFDNTANEINVYFAITPEGAIEIWDSTVENLLHTTPADYADGFNILVLLGHTDKITNSGNVNISVLYNSVNLQAYNDMGGDYRDWCGNALPTRPETPSLEGLVSRPTDTPFGMQVGTGLLDGRVMLTGRYPGDIPTKAEDYRKVYLIDPETGEETLGTQYPVSQTIRCVRPITLMQDGKVIVGNTEVNSGGWPLYIYDPVLDTWTGMASYPYNFSGFTNIPHSLVLATDFSSGTVYGLLTHYFGNRKFAKYDPSTGVWTTLATPSSSSWHPRGMTVNTDGKVLCLVQDSLDKVLKVYTPGSDSWAADVVLTVDTPTVNPTSCSIVYMNDDKTYLVYDTRAGQFAKLIEINEFGTTGALRFMNLPNGLAGTSLGTEAKFPLIVTNVGPISAATLRYAVVGGSINGVEQAVIHRQFGLPV
jgi:hypothetical protein